METEQRHGMTYLDIAEFGNNSDGLLMPVPPACAAPGVCDPNSAQFVAADLCGVPLDTIDANDLESSARLNVALASYLLGKEHSAQVFTTPTAYGMGNGLNLYGCPNRLDAFAAPVGTPCSTAPASCVYRADYAGPPMTCHGASGSVYVRTFTKGVAILNPTDCPQTVTLPAGSFKDLQGNMVTGNYTVLDHNGAVLVTATTLCQ
jgi:hypothetical protein